MIMWTYFRPLRRKFGVASLMLACVLMVGWVRSRLYTDVVNFQIGHHEIGFISKDSSLGLATIRRAVPTSTLLPTIHSETFGRIADWYSAPGTPWRLNWYRWGFSSIVTNAGGESGNIRVAPYWPVVLPLALISAWLLLSKPRPKPQPTPASP